MSCLCYFISAFHDINVNIKNPSINYGSFMAVTVRSVKHSFSDKSLTLSTSIINLMNADTFTISIILMLWWCKVKESVLGERLTSGVSISGC